MATGWNVQRIEQNPEQVRRPLAPGGGAILVRSFNRMSVTFALAGVFSAALATLFFMMSVSSNSVDQRPLPGAAAMVAGIVIYGVGIRAMRLARGAVRGDEVVRSEIKRARCWSATGMILAALAAIGTVGWAIAIHLQGIKLALGSGILGAAWTLGTIVATAAPRKLLHLLS